MMKKLFTLVLALGVSTVMMAQLQLPQPSPSAKVKQEVGLTEIKIEYASPAVNNREVFGGLVAYDQLWRAGANAPTKISFSRDVKIADTDVPAGTYALYMTPRASGEWTLTLNSNENAQAWSRDESNDVVSAPMMVSSVDKHERLVYMITDFDDASATISMMWDKTKASFKVNLHTSDQAYAAIQRATDGLWRDSFGAARYLLAAGDYDMALEQINLSLGMSENWFNTWVKAQILNKKGKNDKAYKYAQKAMDMGNETPESFWYKANVEEALNTWPKS